MLNKTQSSLKVFSLLFPCVFRGCLVNFSICLCVFLLLVMLEIWSLSGSFRRKKTEPPSREYFCNFSLECFEHAVVKLTATTHVDFLSAQGHCGYV